MAYVNVDVEIDMSEIPDDELINEVEHRIERLVIERHRDLKIMSLKSIIASFRDEYTDFTIDDQFKMDY